MGSLHINAVLLIMWCLFFVGFQFVYTHHVNVAAHNSHSAGCIDTERRALVEFKESLVDDAHRLSSWIGKDCCSWDGITCNNLTGHVQKVDLRNPVLPCFEDYPPYSNNFDDYWSNCLGGVINTSICDLEQLVYLDLSSNSFSGVPIPKCFGSFRKLRYLNLSVAGFQGEVPPHLGNLSQLQHLGLASSVFAGLSLASSSFVALSHTDPNLGLSKYFLRVNNLEWVTRFSFLKSLDLSQNDLSECVDWLDSVNRLPTLSSLKLRYCGLPDGKLPSSFNLTSLVSLDIGWNYQTSTSLLKWFSNLTTNLQVLRLDYNFFEGPFPFRLQKFKSLTVFDISQNYFINSSWLLDSLCELTSLTYLDVSFNGLEGSLPACLGNLTSLKLFYFASNSFRGEIPTELCRLKQLTHLGMCDNFINSSIPSCVGELAELQVLGLGGFQVYGTVPSTIGQLSKLKDLRICGDMLTGEISESHFMKLKSLKSVFIWGNEVLTFNVSPQWIPPFHLTCLYINSTLMGNQFPSWLKTQNNVFELHIANVGIADAIPEWFGTTFSSVQQLDLSTNHICGVLPSSLKNLKSLTLLNLSENQFTGSIPKWIGQELSQLGNLNLQSNYFSGVIPSSLKNLEFLQFLYLGNNQLSGTIPEWIGKNLSQLQELGLQSNNFHGNIPIQLCQLSFLDTLKLANNNLTGRIPDCFVMS